MKRLLSMFLAFVLALAVLSPAAYADYGLEAFNNDQLRDLYDCVRQEMKSRGLKLQQDITLREGKYIVGDDILRPVLFAGRSLRRQRQSPRRADRFSRRHDERHRQHQD